MKQVKFTADHHCWLFRSESDVEGRVRRAAGKIVLFWDYLPMAVSKMSDFQATWEMLGCETLQQVVANVVPSRVFSRFTR